jgi:putative hydrolase of the HAD superfamily
MANLFATLTALREGGLKLGLITNGNESIQGRKIERLGLGPYLDAIAISEMLGVHKPDPRIFDHVLNALGVSPSAAAFVGDHPEMDMAGARRSGLVAIWKRDPAWPEPDEVDWIIDDLSELPALVLR